MSALPHCVLFLLGTGTLHAADIALLNDRFAQALATVDRIVVLPTGTHDLDGKKGDEVVFEIKDRTVLASLAAATDITDWTGMPCYCYGFARLEFFRGEQFKFSLNYHHFNRLRCEDGPWTGDAILNDQGRDQFIAWFTAHGYDGFARLLVQSNDYIAQRDHEYAELLALFPPATHALLPPRDDNPSWKHREHAPEFPTAFPDQVVFIHTCWRALGMLASWRGDYGPYVHGEPGTFLKHALDHMDETAARTALEKLPAADNVLWLGAGRQLLDERHDGTWSRVVDDLWVARLAARYLADGPPRDVAGVLRALVKQPGPEVNALLLSFATATAARPDPAPDPTNSLHWPSALATAVLALAKQPYEPARAVIIDQLARAPAGDDRAALEVALALFTGKDQIRVEHLARLRTPRMAAPW